MKRKIVKQGTSTLTISLPSKWVSRFALKSGDEIFIEEKDNSLLLSSTSPHAIDKKTIDLSDLDPLINRSILGAYHTGHDEIKLITGENQKIEQFKNVIDELIGFEIVEEGKNYCILRDISGSSDKEFDNLYRRIFLIIKNIAEESSVLLKENKLADLDSQISKDKEVNKFTNICLRHLNKRGYKEFTKTQMIFSIVKNLEEVGDEYRALLSRIKNEKIEFNNLLQNLFNDLNLLFSSCYEFSFRQTKSRAVSIAKKYSEIRCILDEALSKVQDPKQLKVLFHYNSILEKTLRIQGAQLSFI